MCHPVCILKQQFKGILDANDGGGGEGANVVENDEILEEMRRCQSELKAVSAHNLGQLRRLLKAAKEEMVSNRVDESPILVIRIMMFPAST